MALVFFDDLRQRRFCLGKPESHGHVTVQVDGGSQGFTRLLPLARPGVQRPEATVAVCLERAHAECPGQSQGLTVGGCGSLGRRGIVVRIDLAEEPQGPRLITLSRVRAADLQATHGKCQRLVEAAEAQLRLAQPELDPHQVQLHLQHLAAR
jgi:hypothetical protein